MSFSLPKRCGARASHKYSTSISIIDPSLRKPSQSVILNWFSNDLDQLHFNFKVGDVIRCENLRVTKYNNFPQLSGGSPKSTVHVFHRKEDYSTGAEAHYSREPDAAAATAGTVETRQRINARGAEEIFRIEMENIDMRGVLFKKLRKRKKFSSNACWHVTAFGSAVPAPWITNAGRYRRKAALDRLKKALAAAAAAAEPASASRASIDSLQASQCPMLTIETDYLDQLLQWTRKFLWSTTLAEESLHHTPLHSLLLKIDSLSSAHQYPQLLPRAVVDAAANGASMIAGKCDAVCLVVGKIEPQAADNAAENMLSDDGGVAAMPSRGAAASVTHGNAGSSNAHSAAVGDCAALLLWDGTSNGVMDSQPPFLTDLSPMHRCLQTAILYAQTKDAEDYNNTADRILAERVGESTAPPHRYLGCPLVIRAAAPEFNGHLQRFDAGMWVRIRNLHVTVGGAVVEHTLGGGGSSGAGAGAGCIARAVVQQDTQICRLSPYMW